MQHIKRKSFARVAAAGLCSWWIHPVPQCMFPFILALLNASASAYRLHTTGMSGLCPPVPTELVSVFYVKTGSVQQEQECSLLTNWICVTSPTSTQHEGRQPCWDSAFLLCFRDSRRRPQTQCGTLTLSQWPWGQSKLSPPTPKPVRGWHWTLCRNMNVS